MEKKINILDKVNVEVDKFKIIVSGEKGKLERNFYSPLFKEKVKIEKIDGCIRVSTESENKKFKAEVGTIVAHIRNMMEGVTSGYTYKLKIVYLHFPVTVKIAGDEIVISNFLGEKIPRKAKIIGNVKVNVQDDEIMVTGIDKESVGQTSLNIERATRIKARDRRVFADGIFITERS